MIKKLFENDDRVLYECTFAVGKKMSFRFEGTRSLLTSCIVSDNFFEKNSLGSINKLPKQISNVSCLFLFQGSMTIQYNTIHSSYMQRFVVGYLGICHASLVFSVYPRALCVYEENTSDKWHVPRYPTRKHCITTLSYAHIFRKLTEKVQNIRNASKPYLKSLYDF